MPKFNLGAFGGTLRVNFNQDISTATSYAMTLTPRAGDEKERTSTLGTVDVEVDDETYQANEYIEYVIASGDLDFAGQWEKKGTAVMSPTNTEKTDQTRFRVMS